MKAPDVITIDFETEAIEQRPDYPPAPVGWAIKWPREETCYWAFGHPAWNNCTFATAMRALEEAWTSGLPLLFHGGKFDTAVAYEKLRLPQVPWQQYHDTMFLSFLADPHAPKLGLKELAADLLHMPADEQNALHDWIWSHREQLEQTYGRPVKKSEFGAWIAKAPGELVAPYAIGDVDRTHELFQHLWPIIQREGMAAAYDRERRLLPILMENERVGMRVDMRNLERDIGAYGADMLRIEEWLRDQLGVENFDADREVADALLRNGIVPEDQWQRTKTGQLSVSKDDLLPHMFTDPRIASVLGYRNRLKTCLSMFMEPWLSQASRNKGYITTNWNQTRGYAGGTRSGRPSTNNHNFLNLSKTWEGRDDGYQHPDFLGVMQLPLVRKYILPDDGGVFLHRDFDGQEMRVFANVECGALKQAYLDDPKLDPHGFVGNELSRVTDRDFTSKEARTKVKSLNFQGLYGGGVPALQRKLRCTLAEARELKAFYNRALPGRQIVVDAIKALVRRGEPIVTWGGRKYYCEPPEDGRSMDYKLINYYCQGSAADLTKEALCMWYYGTGRRARFLVTVYDEINISTAVEDAEIEMEWLKEAMEFDRLDVAMLTSGKRGPSWGELECCE
jgi:DNA polymerase-1